MTIDLVEMACDPPVVLSHETNLGKDGLADGHSLFTSRVERAPHRLSEEARRGSRNGVEFRRVQIDHGSEEPLSVRMVRLPA